MEAVVVVRGGARAAAMPRTPVPQADGPAHPPGGDLHAEPLPPSLDIYSARERFLGDRRRAAPDGTFQTLNSDVSEQLCTLLKSAAPGEAVLIGRLAAGPIAQNHIVLSAITTSRNHVAVAPSGYGTYHVKTLGKGSVKVWEPEPKIWRKLERLEELSSGRTLSFGGFTATLPSTSFGPHSSRSPQEEISRIFCGRTPGTTMELGRTEGDVLIENSMVSRRHLQITLEPGGTFRVADLNSRNGTFYQDASGAWAQVPSEGCSLPPGTRLRLCCPDYGTQIHLPGNSDSDVKLKPAPYGGAPEYLRAEDSAGQPEIFCVERGVAWKAPGAVEELAKQARLSPTSKPLVLRDANRAIAVSGLSAEQALVLEHRLAAIALPDNVRELVFVDDLGTFESGTQRGVAVRAIGPNDYGSVVISKHVFALEDSLLARAGLVDTFKTLQVALSDIAAHAAKIEKLSGPQRRIYTVAHIGRAASDGQLSGASLEAPYGMFRDYPILGRDMKITGSVVPPATYKNGHQRPGILIDDSPEMQALFDEFNATCVAPHVRWGRIDPLVLLEGAQRFVSARLQYSDKADAEVIRKNGGDPNAIVSLSHYKRAGKGVCEHQALLVGYFVEKTCELDLCNGWISLERNEAAPAARAEDGGHAWLRYSDPELGAFVADPAQHYVGRVEDAKNWLYARPSDVEALRRLAI